jgi:hypothetical protein
MTTPRMRSAAEKPPRWRCPTRARPIHRLSAYFAFLCALAACTPPVPADSAEVQADTASLDVLRAEARAQVGDPTCTMTAQCRTIPFGAKPCGGPWSYLVYSVATTDSAQLAGAVDRYTAREHDLNRLEQRVSDCGLVTEPDVMCADGQCVPVEGGAPAAPWGW